MRHSLFLTVAVTTLTSGCYLFHTKEDGGGIDGAAPDAPGVDGSGLDASVPDAGLDAPIDAPADGGPDAEPPDEPPPLPGRCRTEPVISPFTDPVLEYEWPSSAVVHRAAIHVCATPVVLDLDPMGDELHPNIIFVSYEALSRDIVGGYLRIVDPRTDTTITYPALEGTIPVSSRARATSRPATSTATGGARSSASERAPAPTRSAPTGRSSGSRPTRPRASADCTTRRSAAGPRSPISKATGRWRSSSVTTCSKEATERTGGRAPTTRGRGSISSSGRSIAWLTSTETDAKK